MTITQVLPRDAIQSIDDAQFGREYFGDADDEVVVLTSRGDGPARAYPIRVLGHHEIVNDVIDEVPVAVTWCPICWSVAVYERTVDGRVLTFGVSGALDDDALVMYDRETESLWRQPSGECLDGPLAGQRLTTVPATTVTYRVFRDRYPDGVVLDPPRGDDDATTATAYDMTPYEEYRQGETFGLYGMRGEGQPREWDRTDIDAKALVLGVEIDGTARGYPLSVVESDGGLVVDTLGGRDILVVAHDGRLRAFDAPAGDVDYDGERLIGEGTTWDPVTGESAGSSALDRIGTRTLFAFAWQDDHGPDAFYGGGDR